MNGKEMTTWIFGLLMAAVVLCAPVACTMSRQATVAEAIRNGADPISAKCAIEADTGQSAVCVAAAVRNSQAKEQVRP